MMTKREQARYRAIVRQLDRMRRRGWEPNTHPDFEPLETELLILVNKLTGEAA